MPFVKVLCSQGLHLSGDLFTEIFRIKYFAAGGGALNPEVVLMGMCTGQAGSSLAGGLSFFWPTTERGGCGQVSHPRSIAPGADKTAGQAPVTQLSSVTETQSLPEFFLADLWLCYPRLSPNSATQRDSVYNLLYLWSSCWILLWFPLSGLLINWILSLFISLLMRVWEFLWVSLDPDRSHPRQEFAFGWTSSKWWPFDEDLWVVIVVTLGKTREVFNTWNMWTWLLSLRVWKRWQKRKGWHRDSFSWDGEPLEGGRHSSGNRWCLRVLRGSFSSFSYAFWKVPLPDRAVAKDWDLEWSCV